jgi:hypothetical protein
VAGAYLGLGHSLASLVLLQPSYFREFFLPDARMSVRIELSVVIGIAALLGMLRLAIGSAHASGASRLPLARVCLLLIAAHTAGTGLPGWLEPGAWPGGMVPLTLIGFALAMGGLALSWFPHRAGS